MSTLKVAVTADDHAEGPEDAPLTLVEYGDYQCSHCAQAHEVLQQIRRQFGDRLRLVFRNFPLTQTHELAQEAAEVAEFAAAHGKFWPMHDLLFENQSRMDRTLFPALARKLDLSVPALSMALEEGQFKDRVRTDFMSGVRSGVNGTPTFFLNGVRYDGSWELAELSHALEAVTKPSE